MADADCHLNKPDFFGRFRVAIVATCNGELFFFFCPFEPDALHLAVDVCFDDDSEHFLCFASTWRNERDRSVAAGT